MTSRWPPPIRVMLPLVLLGFVGVASYLVIVFEVRSAHERVEDTMRDRAAVVGAVVASELEARYRNREVAAVRRTVTTLVADPRLLLASLVGPDGTVWIATDPAVEGDPTPPELWADVGFVEGRPTAWVGRTAVARDGQQVVGAFPVRVPADPDDVLPEQAAALVLRYDLTVPKAVASRSGLFHGIVIAASGALLTLLLWWYLARLVSGRIERLVTQARRLGERDDEPATPVLTGGDELAELATAIADMAGWIREGKRDLARRETILTAVSSVARRILAAESPEDVMDEVLEPLGRAAGVDRVYVFRDDVDEEGRPVARYRWEWTAPGIRSQIDTPELQAMPWDPVFSRWRKHFMEGRPVAGVLAEFPDLEREVLEAQEIRALAAVPISVRDRLYGFLGFDDTEHEHEWSDGELGALQTAAGVMGAALERAEAHRRVRRSEVRLRSAQRIARLGHWEWNLDEGTRVEWPRQTYDIFGLDPDSFSPTSESWLEHVHDEDRPRVERVVEEAVATASAYEVEFRIVRPDGEVRTLHVHGQVEQDQAGRSRRLSGTVQDITALREAERHRRELESQLRQSQKLEAVGQLTGGIAHDFNNLLAVILTNAQLIEDELTPEAASLRTELGDLREAALSAADLVQGLLGFSRQAALELQPMDLNAGVESTLQLLRRVIPVDIDIRVELADVAVPVKADPKAVQQVLINLVNNARDAVRDGGTLRIGVGVRTLAEGELPGVAPGGYGTVTVADTGIGIPEEIRDRIFEPFFTTKEPGAGTGLGLATVHGLVTQHGGFVEVESGEGHGTTFTVGLPGAKADAPRARDGAEATLVRGDEQILLVEDQDAVRRTTERALRRLGYSVVSASDGLAALSMMERLDGTVDLIVSDLVMPEMGGIDLAARVRDRYPEVPFVFVSGYASAELAQRGEAPAGFTYLRKPWTIHELAERVRTALDGTPSKSGASS